MRIHFNLFLAKKTVQCYGLFFALHSFKQQARHQRHFGTARSARLKMLCSKLSSPRAVSVFRSHYIPVSMFSYVFTLSLRFSTVSCSQLRQYLVQCLFDQDGPNGQSGCGGRSSPFPCAPRRTMTTSRAIKPNFEKGHQVSDNILGRVSTDHEDGAPSPIFPSHGAFGNSRYLLQVVGGLGTLVIINARITTKSAEVAATGYSAESPAAFSVR